MVVGRRKGRKKPDLRRSTSYLRIASNRISPKKRARDERRAWRSQGLVESWMCPRQQAQEGGKDV